MYYQQPQYVQQGGAYPVYAQPKVVQQLEETLTKEEITSLLKSGGGFSFTPTLSEVLNKMCNHVHDGRWCLTRVRDRIYECSICHKQIDLDKSTDPVILEECVKYIDDTFQKIKIKGNGIITKELFRSLAEAFVLLDKLPKINELVERQFDRLGNQNTQNIYMNSEDPGVESMVRSMLGSGAYGYAQQPPIVNPYAGAMAAPAIPMYYPQQQIIHDPNTMVNPFAGGITQQQPVYYQQATPIQGQYQQQPYYPTQAPVQQQPAPVVQQVPVQQPAVPVQQQGFYPNAQPAAAPQQQPGNNLVKEKTFPEQQQK